MANESRGEKDVIGNVSEATASVPSEILHAHSIEGEIDHEKLTREIIARFPKILAELAK